MSHYICNRCGCELTSENKANGRRRCKDCQKNFQREQNDKNREKINKRMKELYHINKVKKSQSESNSDSE